MSRPARLLAAALVFALGVTLAHGEPAAPVLSAGVHPAPWALAATVDGETLFVACGTAGHVAVVDVATRRVRRRLDVGGTPRSLAIAPVGDLLAVSLDPEDEVVLYDLPALSERSRVPAPRGPEGLAFDAAGRRLWVAGKIAGVVALLDLGTGQEIARHAAGREPFAVATRPARDLVAVVSRRAAVAPPDTRPWSDVTILDAASAAVRARYRLPSFHLSESAVFTADGLSLLVPGIRVKNLLPIVQVARGWVLSASIAVVDVETGDVDVLPLQDVDRGFADPAGLVLAPDGDRGWVASGGSDQVAPLRVEGLVAAARARGGDDAEDFTLTPGWRGEPIRVGDNPRGLAWLGRGRLGEVAVAERLDDSVVFLDGEGRLVARIGLGGPASEAPLHAGERAFFDASYCFQAQFSCTSCHPEGHTDGLTYDFDIDGVGRDLLLNRSLLGLAGTAPFKWSGINPSLQRQCGARFAMVLTRADLIPKETLDHMAAWLLSLPAPRPLVDAGAADAEAKERIERGQRIFARSRRKDGTLLRPGERCITCHAPPLYSNFQRTDVGTRSRFDRHGAFDTPHLVGIGTKAPFLHDGRAVTLAEIWTQASEPDRHGVTSDLTPAELGDLVLFLESL